MGESASGRKAALRDELARARATWLETVGSLSEADLSRPVFSEGSTWTAKDLIGHVAYAEGGMLRTLRGSLAAEPTRLPPDFDLDRWNEGTVRRAREQSVAQLLARMEESRRECAALLDSLDDADLDRPTVHPSAGETTVGTVLSIIARHERGHAQDLRAAGGERGAGA